MEKKSKFSVIEESRFLNIDDYGRIQGGGTDHCKDGTALYAVCTGSATLSIPGPCAINYQLPCKVEPGQSGGYFLCGQGYPYDWGARPEKPAI